MVIRICSVRFTSILHREVMNGDEEFLTLSFEQLDSLLSSDQLRASERHIFEGLLRWITHDSQNRQAVAGKLLDRVRFALMPPHYIGGLSQSETFLLENPFCKEYIDEALNFQFLPSETKSQIHAERMKPRASSKVCVFVNVKFC